MEETRHLLNVLMDGIKDAGMWLDYAEHAKKNDNKVLSDWFTKHAKSRIAELDTMYSDINQVIGLDEKAKTDAISRALKHHLIEQIHALKTRI